MDLVAIIARLAGRTPPKRPTPPWLMKLVARGAQLKSVLTGREPGITPEAAAMVCREIQCNCSKAMSELGFESVPLESMAKDSYVWLEQQGLLRS